MNGTNAHKPAPMTRGPARATIMILVLTVVRLIMAITPFEWSPGIGPYFPTTESRRRDTLGTSPEPPLPPALTDSRDDGSISTAKRNYRSTASRRLAQNAEVCGFPHAEAPHCPHRPPRHEERTFFLGHHVNTQVALRATVLVPCPFWSSFLRWGIASTTTTPDYSPAFAVPPLGGLSGGGVAYRSLVTHAFGVRQLVAALGFSSVMTPVQRPVMLCGTAHPWHGPVWAA